MSITDKIAEKFAGAFGYLLLKELRRIAVGQEKGIDSYREIHGFRPLFAEEKPPAEVAIEEERLDAEPPDPTDSPEAGHDYMRLEILEALAIEAHLPIDPTTDLIALGKERGWLDSAGEIQMLPAGYGQ